MGEGTATAESEADIARDLSNPVAALISVPMQFHYDRGMGPAEDGRRTLLNIQPVLPFSLTPEWNLISPTIIPVIDQKDVTPGGESQSGLSDIVQSLFFSPKKPTASGRIRGVGPVFLLPTATNDLLGLKKWGLGPTGVVLTQRAVGALANHIWSVAGDSDRENVNATFVQPFVTYSTPTRTTFALNTESTYNWQPNQWAVPINFNVNQLLKVGDQLVQVGAGARYWAEGPDGAPTAWGGRVTLSFLFPR
jgi:hypothetical protein